MHRILGTLALGLSIAAAPALTAAADSTERLVDNAQRLRAEFGLASSEAIATASFAARETYDNMDWGVPLTQAEANELYQRVKITDKVEPIIPQMAERQGYAGMYFDQLREGIPVFLYTERRAAAEKTAMSKLGSLAVEVRKVERSLADLAKIKNDILADEARFEDQGALLTSVGFDIIGNRVEVGVLGGIAKVRAMLADYGDGVHVYEMAPPRMDACNSAQECRPAKGGIKLIGQVSYCTSGFMGRRLDDPDQPLVLFTAGHCHEFAQGSWNRWEHGIGTGKETVGWNEQDGIIYDSSAADQPTDVMLIDLRGAFEPATIWNKVLVASGSQTVTTVTSFATDQNAHNVGTPVCRMGAGSAETSGFPSKVCGTVKKKSQTNRSCKGPGTSGPCTWIKNTVKVSFDSIGGDSGGPYWKGPQSGTSPVKAMGIHVHSEYPDTSSAKGWYTPIHRAIAALDWKNGVTVKVCTDTNC